MFGICSGIKKSFKKTLCSFNMMVDPTGLEPVTSSMPWKRSTK